VFGTASRPGSEPPVDLKALHAKIGQFVPENDFLSGALGKAGLLSGKWIAGTPPSLRGIRRVGSGNIQRDGFAKSSGANVAECCYHYHLKRE
jgi:hypothetical protein